MNLTLVHDDKLIQFPDPDPVFNECPIDFDVINEPIRDILVIIS